MTSLSYIVIPAIWIAVLALVFALLYAEGERNEYERIRVEAVRDEEEGA